MLVPVVRDEHCALLRTLFPRRHDEGNQSGLALDVVDPKDLKHDFITNTLRVCSVRHEGVLLEGDDPE